MTIMAHQVHNVLRTYNDMLKIQKANPKGNKDRVQASKDKVSISKEAREKQLKEKKESERKIGD